MTRLPGARAPIQSYSREINAMRGLNLSDYYQDGDLADCENLSIRRYPYFTTRRERQMLDDYSGTVSALTSWEKLVVVMDGHLYYDGVARGEVTDGEKQFAVVNSKLIIWPDKKYLDMNTLTVNDLAAQTSGTGATFTEDTVTLTSAAADLTTLFTIGDCVTISGCGTLSGNNRTVVIKALTADSITITDAAAQAEPFDEGTESGTISLEREVPDLDFICVSSNRLWGCCNATKTIHASSLGEPGRFYVNEGLSTDSYALNVASEGDFTGCCRLSGSVLFWKERTLHKLLGDYPAEYALYDYNLEGVLTGCHKSMQIVNETLYYMSAHGIYAYSGGTTALLSPEFGEHHFTDGVAGSDGLNYYLSAREGDEHHLLVYNTIRRTWVREDDTEALDFTRIGRDLYFLDASGSIWLADSGRESSSLTWHAQFKPFYETVEGRKGYSKLHLRVQLPQASYLIAELRYDGKRWIKAGEIRGGKADAVLLPLTIERCDQFELRVRGKGQCTILSVLREFFVGSDA